jgi:1-acyl-sn-glycerol-3-phosphate acyltransferase
MSCLQTLRSAFAWTNGIVATVFFTLIGMALAAVPGGRLLQHKFAGSWGRVCIWGTGCPVRIEGLDRIDLERRFVVMVNHQSALDIPLLIGVIPARWQTIFWAKQSLFRVPVLGWAMRTLGHMPIDRINRRTAGKMLAESAERITDQRSVLVFPEETYSRENGLLPFQRGGFLLALKTGLPILPVGVAGTKEALPPGRRVITPTTLTVRFGEPIPTAGLAVSSRQNLSDRTRLVIADLAGISAS